MSSTPNYGFPQEVKVATTTTTDAKVCAIDAIDRELKRIEELARCKSGVDKCEFNNHLTTPEAHKELFEKKVDRQDGYGLISNDCLEQIVQGKDRLTLLEKYIQELQQKNAQLEMELSNKSNYGTPVLYNPEELLSTDFIRRPYDCYYYKNQFNEVTVCLSVEKKNLEPIKDLDTILTLPVGFRPRAGLELPAVYHGPWQAAYIRIYTDGKVCARMSENHSILSMYFSFIVEE